VNEDILKGKWKEIKGGLKEQWGKLSDDDLVQIEGKVEKLSGILQEKYGYSKEKAEEAYKGFVKKYQR